MESTPHRDDAHDALREAERAAAAPLIDYPPTPGWYPYAMGAWFAALVGVATYRPSSPVAIACLGVLIALLCLFVRWYSRKRGTWPTLSNAPREFRRVFAWYGIGVAVVAAIVIPLAIWAAPVVATMATFLLVTTGLTGYERLYAQAAEAVRERLA